MFFLEYKMAHLCSLLSRVQLLNVSNKKNQNNNRKNLPPTQVIQTISLPTLKRRRRKATWRGRGASAAGHGNVYVYSTEAERNCCCLSALLTTGAPSSKSLPQVTYFLSRSNTVPLFLGASLRIPSGCPKMCQKEPLLNGEVQR